jgi:transposase
MRRRRSRLSAQQTHVLLEQFVAGTPARPAAALAGVHRNTAILFYLKLRELIARRMARPGPIKGAIALDSLEVDDAHRDEFKRVARGSTAPRAQRLRLRLEAIIEPGVLRLALVNGRDRPSGEAIDNFIRAARQHLRRFNGLPRQHLHLFLEECAWRFNYGPSQHLLQILTRWFEQDSQNEGGR